MYKAGDDDQKQSEGQDTQCKDKVSHKQLKVETKTVLREREWMDKEQGTEGIQWAGGELQIVVAVVRMSNIHP